MIAARFILLFTVASIGLAGCVSREALQTRQIPIGHIDLENVKDGEYSGDFTYSGFTYMVNVAAGNHAITRIDVIHNRDTSHAKKAEGVISRIMAEQKNDVDAVSGATTTSKALLKAVENALRKGVP
jgi:uncharacterized protein with FMN-binding domain